MLKTVRYHGLRARALNVVWLQAATTAITAESSPPSSSSAAKFTAKASDMVSGAAATWRGIGTVNLITDARMARSRSAKNSAGRPMASHENLNPRTRQPIVETAKT